MSVRGRARRHESGGGSERTIVVYSKPGCHLCEEAMESLREIQSEVNFDLEERDISDNERWLHAYFDRIPVVTLDGEELFEYFVDRERLLASL